MAIQYVWQGGDSGDYVPVEVPDEVAPVAAPVAPTTTNVASSAPVDVNAIAQQIYGRDLSPSEQAALAGMSADQVSNVLTQSLAQFNAQQPAGIATLPTSTQQVANTAVNPSLEVMGGQSGQGGIANIAQQQMQNAAAPGQLSTEEKNFLDWRLAQRPDPFTSPWMSGYATIGDYYKATGQDPYSAAEQKFAQDSLSRWNAVGDIREKAFGNRGNEWENPNWQTITALERAATEAERVKTANTPSPFTAGPGPAAKPQNLTLDPLYASIVGNTDPDTILRAVNIMKRGEGAYKQSGIDPAAAALAASLKDKALPQSVLDKLFPAYKATTQTAAPAPAGTTPAPAPAPAGVAPAPAPAATGSSGVTVKDYQGNAFDTGQIKNLAKQIAQNFDLKNSSGAAFITQGQSIGFDYNQAKTILGKEPSAAEQVMMDIARQLQQKGVTDLSQIGVRNVVVDREYGDSGQTRPEIQKEFYNKDTGEKIAGQDESIGSTFTGKGATYYNLSVGADGKPVIRTQAADTSDAGMAAMLLPVLLGPAGLNVSGALTGALGSAGVTGIAGQAIAQGLLGAGTSALFGGDPLKGALSGAISPVVSAGIGSILPTDLQGTTLGNFLTRAGGAAAMGALSGGDPSKAIANAALSGIAGAALSKAGIPSDFAPALVSLVKNGTITPQAAMQMISQMGKKG